MDPLVCLAVFLLVGCQGSVPESTRVYPVRLSEQEWRKKLTPQQYQILREKATERAFTGKYAQHHQEGTYLCAGCRQPLFDSREKFDSGTGWPSFTAPLSPSAVVQESDNSHGMTRVEVVCSACGGHLGHVFDDGPRPTGMRYCINSDSLEFSPRPKP